MQLYENHTICNIFKYSLNNLGDSVSFSQSINVDLKKTIKIYGSAANTQVLRNQWCNLKID